MSILTEFEQIGTLEVAITGGEPLCYAGIVPLLHHATRSGLNCILTTNGTLINENIAQQLAKAGLFEIKVSFEGGRERNDSIRGIGVYDRAMQGLNALTEHGINTSVRLTLHNGSEVGLDELFSDMVGANVTRVKITVVKPIGRAALPENNDLLGFDISQEAYNHINDLGSRYGISMHFSSDDFPFRPELLNDDKPRCQKYNNCGAGFETAYISPTGDVLPCSSMPEIILGNISEADFITIWNGERSRRFRKFAQRCNVQRLCTCTGIRNFLN